MPAPKKPSEAEKVFRAKAPGIMRRLLRDFAISVDDAAAIVGNLGHECAGFTKLQEINPVVKGSKGGYGWAQWTGPRRRAFENWCKERKLGVASDTGNYGFLVAELRGPEKKAIPAVVAAGTLAAKVKAFERAYERAGVTHYASRNRWAALALDAWHTTKSPEKPVEKPKPVPESPTPADPSPQPQPPSTPAPAPNPPTPKRRGFWGTLGALLGIGVSAGGGAAVSQAEANQVAAIVIGAVVIAGVAGLVGFIIYRRMAK